jgi:polysaccharide biosynthesis protein PslG
MLALGLAPMLALSPASAAAPSRARALPGTPVPFGFVGVDVDGPMITPADNVNLATQDDVMVANGVQSIRIAFNWASAQPYRSWANVPRSQASAFRNGVGNVPTSFATTDQIVRLAAQRGLSVLPTILYTPGWDAATFSGRAIEPPSRTAPFANYLTTLIRRYGPHGSFWSSNPSVRREPIRAWQIWNEENLATYWPQPFAGSYVALLRAAHAAIRSADPGAKVVLGSLTNYVWVALGQIYAVPGARQLFDEVSVNAFTSTPSNLILFLRLVRRSMAASGDPNKPLLDTEMSWPSGLGQTSQPADWNTTQRGQARDIEQTLPMLAAQRRSLGLVGFYYYTWMDAEYHGAPSFAFAGLERYVKGGQIVAKPALAAFKQFALELEGCRKKGRVATQCLK